jgi:alkanesulfonate monooxygenase SsuD/methylene tetrahydromethanopterin reductase-like flavin-dependent oxidoreductase (luciferase family)
VGIDVTGAPDARGGKQRKQIHLGAQFRWVNSQIEFESFAHLAETAERGMFDFLFLAEGLRPDTFTVLAALATVTDRLGLIGTINTTSNEPFEVARQFATLDHLSDGRAGWNVGIDVGIDVVTSHADRYTRAEEFVTVARRFWDSWDADAVGGRRQPRCLRPTRSHPPRRIPRHPVRRARRRHAAGRSAGPSDRSARR